MGEAKRRKQIDPNYGKVRSNQAELWYQQMLANLPRNFRIDEGHRLYRTHGNTPLGIMLSGIMRIENDRQAKMIQFKGKDSVLSLIVSNEQFENTDWIKLPILLCVPMLDERYQPYTGEWVLPYQVVDIQANPKSPGKVAEVKNIYQNNGISWDNFCVKNIIIYSDHP
jgi:hypothetical protein